MSEILRVQGIEKNFRQRKRSGFKSGYEIFPVLKDVSFTVRKGEIFGIVGESGSGKTTLGRILIKLLNADKGEIWFENQDISAFSTKQFAPLRRKIQMVFQNPQSIFNPSLTIGDHLLEAQNLYKSSGRSLYDPSLDELLGQVRLNSNILKKYSHQVSGGEARRVGLARILAVNPEVIILDEPVASLDLSVKGEILKLLLELQAENGLTYLWISHDLELMNRIADRIMVMFGGHIVEIYNNKIQPAFEAVHPYTRKLQTAAQRLTSPFMEWEYNGNDPDASYVSRPQQNTGCIYFNNCELAKKMNDPEECQGKGPALSALRPGHSLACHFPQTEMISMED